MTKKEKKPEEKPLTPKDKAVLNRYFLHMNGTRAWLETHPKSGYDSARSSVAEFLAKPNIRAEVNRRIAVGQMAADEAIAYQSDIARGDIGELMEITSVGGSLDLKSAKDKGLTKLIKKFKQKTTIIQAKTKDGEDKEIHELELELYAADAAQTNILKMGGKLKDANLTINVKLTDD